MRGAAAATLGQRSSTGHLPSGSDSSKRAKNPAKPRCAASSMPSSENNFLDPAGSQVRAASSHQESRGGVSEIFQEALSEIQEEGMRDAARLVNGPGSSTNGAKEETARPKPKSSTMTAPIERTESIVLGGSTSALERSHNCAPAGGWRVSPKNLDGVCLPAEGNNRAADLSGNRGKSLSKKNRVSDNFPSELFVPETTWAQRW